MNAVEMIESGRILTDALGVVFFHSEQSVAHL